MKRFLMIILLLFSTLTVVAHGILVYQYSATAAIIAEEETPHDKPLKEAKELSHEKIGYTLDIYSQSIIRTLCKAAMDRSFRCSKGFYKIPYNPPETIQSLVLLF